MALGVDVHSYANFKQVLAKHYDIHIKADFCRQIFHGFVDVKFEVLEASEKNEVLLDTKDLAIERVEEVTTGERLSHTLTPNHAALGLALRISLPDNAKTVGSTVTLRIYYNTTQLSGGIQWFLPEQTVGKVHPYVYTQCEAILARTLLPCQDTPSVKTPYSISVTVPSPLVAACSGTPVQSNPTFEEDGSLTWTYIQKVPIPAYLIAVVAGALKKASVGPRSTVWTEKELLDASVYEFSEDTENYIKAGEELTQIPYEWGTYDLVVLPNAFPYGGMENPQLTFLSASLLAGDRSLTNVVAHEIAHSWAGNLVTNASWEDFWLNEGFCVYLERQILGHVKKSDEYRYFEMLIGYNDLKKTVADLGETNEFTKLRPSMTGIDPDEAFSKIPYEKGSLFLFFLETKVGSAKAMLEWINSYYRTNTGKSVSTEDFQQSFLNHFTGKVDAAVLASINWDEWYYKTGLPSFDPTEKLLNKYTQSCIALADKWLKQNGEGCTKDDLVEFSSKQKMYFLDLIITQGTPFKHELISKMDSLYEFSKTKNVEMSFRYLLVCLRSEYREALPLAAQFLSIHGRGLYVKPLFKALNDVDHAFAVDVYAKNRARFHSVIRNMFDSLLLK